MKRASTKKSPLDQRQCPRLHTRALMQACRCTFLRLRHSPLPVCYSLQVLLERADVPTTNTSGTTMPSLKDKRRKRKVRHGSAHGSKLLVYLLGCLPCEH